MLLYCTVTGGLPQINRLYSLWRWALFFFGSLSFTSETFSWQYFTHGRYHSTDRSPFTSYLHIALSPHLPDYCQLSMFRSLSFPHVKYKKKFYLEEIHSDENLCPLNPLILKTCNAVIMCDWRMKEGGELSRSRNDKKEDEKKAVALMGDKWKELASNPRCLAPELLPSISYIYCSREPPWVTLDIWPQRL